MLSKTKQHISIWLFSIIITYLRKQIRISFQKEDLLKSKSRQMSGCFFVEKKIPQNWVKISHYSILRNSQCKDDIFPNNHKNGWGRT